jgi:serine/threonine-protein kinase
VADGTSTELGGYVLGEEIGSGASSIVYAATHARLGRRAAVKVLVLPPRGAWRERFLRESQLAAAIDHPNVIPVYEAGEDGGRMFIAMRYVEGPDLRELLEREAPLPLPRTSRIVTQVAAALDAAHARGLVHRDVKPANILLEAGDHVYLSDFGVAKDPAAGLGLTRTGGFLGSVEYCAPEQIEGRDLDGRADVYSLACVAYECLTGTPPFHRPSEVAVLHAHLNAAPPDVREARPDAPRAVADVLREGMARDPGDRFESGAAFARALERAARGARRQVHVARHRAALITALSALALLAGGAIGFAIGSGRGGSTTTSTTTSVSTVVSTVRVADVHALADAASAQLKIKNYALALDYARRAYAALGTVPASDLYHGYVNYDVGAALTRLGRCPEAVPYLQRADRLEPHTKAVAQMLKLAHRC